MMALVCLWMHSARAEDCNLQSSCWKDPWPTPKLSDLEHGQHGQWLVDRHIVQRPTYKLSAPCFLNLPRPLMSSEHASNHQTKRSSGKRHKQSCFPHTAFQQHTALAILSMFFFFFLDSLFSSATKLLAASHACPRFLWYQRKHYIAVPCLSCYLGADSSSGRPASAEAATTEQLLITGT